MMTADTKPSFCVGSDTVTAEINNEPVTLNKRWYQEPKPTSFMQHSRDDPMQKSEMRAAAMRSSKRAEIISSKRKRGESNQSLVTDASDTAQVAGE
jgi:hypothetical protein